MSCLMKEKLKRIVRVFFNISEILHRIVISKKLRTSYLVYVRKHMEIIGSKYIHVGKRFSAGSDVKIEAWDHHINEKYSPEIVIGDEVFFNNRTHISAINNMKIGNGVLVGSDVLICDNNHGRNDNITELNIPPQKRKLYSKGSINIEDNVWIGDKCVILGGVTIGTGAIIGAGAIVTKDIPAYSIAAGNPAKVIKNISKQEMVL